MCLVRQLKIAWRKKNLIEVKGEMFFSPLWRVRSPGADTGFRSQLVSCWQDDFGQVTSLRASVSLSTNGADEAS